ncbi:MAG TPA: hypothetical protein DIW81_14570 [Planctomycetaceae bacterium]|nr:hypothetical protein [Rubinisphaera sp.]HCS52792.1 hypothetical protein [Planctomycetaceae bacterium]
MSIRGSKYQIDDLNKNSTFIQMKTLAHSFVLILIAFANTTTVCAASSSGLFSKGINTTSGSIPIASIDFEDEQDRDYDRLPDDWMRRKGLDFRDYVLAEIDYTQAAQGRRSLRIEANGSNAAYYSQPISIDAQHSYVMSASILTRGLKYNAAVVTFSFLNQRKQRIHRIVTDPISGTHKEWSHLQLEPLIPDENVRFVVVGCHLISSSKNDITGSAWFDHICIGKLPRLKLASDFETHFRQSDARVTIESSATGLDTEYDEEDFQYELKLHSEDVYGKLLDRTSTVITKAMIEESIETENAGETFWELPVYPPGYYRVRATLLRNDVEIVSQWTSFAVLNLIGKTPEKGEFGWNLSGTSHDISADDMLAITRESGINWVKMPVWKQAYSQQSSETGQLLTGLRNQSIIPIGMLVNPPAEIRNKYSEEWTGISELFTSPPLVWRQAANQVMALYSPTVTRWQLGDDLDSSFVGMPKYVETMDGIRHELQRIGQIRQLGVRWNIDSPVQKNQLISKNFLTLIFDENTSFENFQNNVDAIHSGGYQAWAIVKADAKISQSDPHQRANNLVRRMIDAKRSGADLIFAYDVFDPEYGLLNLDGSPSDLFLPWRTVTLALNGSQYAGSIQLPNRSTNHVFLRDDEATIVMWNDDPVTEEIYLGDQVFTHSVWGEKTFVTSSPINGRQKIEVTSVPTILTGCSAELARWRMGVKFQKGRIASSAAEHEDSLLVTNAFPWSIQGSVQIIPNYGWEISPRKQNLSSGSGEQTELPFSVKLPSQTAIGEQLMAIEFDLGGSELNFPFRVYRDYLVGMGDVHMEVRMYKSDNGQVIVEQIITNETNPPEVIEFRCNLLIRGRRRHTSNMPSLVSGQTRKVVYMIPEFEKLEAKDLWLRADQKNGARTLNELLNEEQVMKLLERSRVVNSE